MKLTHIAEFNKEDFLFGSLPYNSQFDYKRIKIETAYGSDRTGPLLVETAFFFGFGAKELLEKTTTGRATGYSIPVCLWGKQSEPTDEERQFQHFIQDIYHLCYKS